MPYANWDLRGSPTIQEEVKYVRDSANKRVKDNVYWGTDSGSVELTGAKTSITGGGDQVDIGDTLILDDLNQTRGVIRRILRAGKDADNDVAILELPNGRFAAHDVLTANKAKNESEGDAIQYQGSQWFVKGSFVRYGLTWFRLTNERKERNIMLRQTRDNILGHTPNRSPGQFFIPENRYQIKGSLWVLNDLYLDQKIGMADMVKVGDFLTHKQITAKDLKKYEAGKKGKERGLKPSHWSGLPLSTQNNTLRRRLPSLPPVGGGIGIGGIGVGKEEKEEDVIATVAVDPRNLVRLLQQLRHPMDMGARDFNPFGVPGLDAFALWGEYVDVLSLSSQLGLFSRPTEYFNLHPKSKQFPTAFESRRP